MTALVTTEIITETEILLNTGIYLSRQSLPVEVWPNQTSAPEDSDGP